MRTAKRKAIMARFAISDSEQNVLLNAVELWRGDDDLPRVVSVHATRSFRKATVVDAFNFVLRALMGGWGVDPGFRCPGFVVCVRVRVWGGRSWHQQCNLGLNIRGREPRDVCIWSTKNKPLHFWNARLILWIESHSTFVFRVNSQCWLIERCVEGFAHILLQEKVEETWWKCEVQGVQHRADPDDSHEVASCRKPVPQPITEQGSTRGGRLLKTTDVCKTVVVLDSLVAQLQLQRPSPCRLWPKHRPRPRPRSRLDFGSAAVPFSLGRHAVIHTLRAAHNRCPQETNTVRSQIEVSSLKCHSTRVHGNKRTSINSLFVLLWANPQWKSSLVCVVVSCGKVHKVHGSGSIVPGCIISSFLERASFLLEDITFILICNPQSRSVLRVLFQDQHKPVGAWDDELDSDCNAVQEGDWRTGCIPEENLHLTLFVARLSSDASRRQWTRSNRWQMQDQRCPRKGWPQLISHWPAHPNLTLWYRTLSFVPNHPAPLRPGPKTSPPSPTLPQPFPLNPPRHTSHSTTVALVAAMGCTPSR